MLQNTFDGDICPEFIVHRVVEADIPKLQQTILEAGEDYIVFDIGHGCFDHHQDDSPCREGTDDAPGIPYASFGRLWNRWGKNIFNNDDILDEFDRAFVQPIDAHDNGLSVNPLSVAIASMNPNWNETGDANTSFEMAVDMVSDILASMFRSYAAKLDAYEYVMAAAINAEDHVMILERFAPYKQYTKGSVDIDFVIWPSKRNSDWNIGTILAEDGGAFSSKYLLPEAWVDAADRYKPDGMTFCHKARFIAAFKTKEQALAAAKIASAACRDC